MNETVHIENAVLGGGEAGKYLAWDLAQQGRPVVVIERALVGGSCPNIACLPSKNVIRSAKVADLVSRATSYGVRVGGATVEMAGVHRRKREMVDGMVAIHRKKFGVPHLEFVLADGQLVGPRTVEARLPEGRTRRFVADRLFLNLGTRATIPSVPGLADARPLTHVEALELDRLPAHLIVLGGGYVGVEFAQAFRRFGSRVTIVQRDAQLLPREDTDVAEAVTAIMRDDGIDVIRAAEAIRVERTDGGVRLLWRPRGADGDETAVDGTRLLVATGRVPNTGDLGLDAAGVETDPRGYVRVNERLETTAQGVYAIGDVKGGPAFTHISYDDFRILRTNLLERGSATTAERVVPYTVFIDPQLGAIGMTEREARQAGKRVRVATLPMSSVARALEVDETRGLMKAVVDADTNEILGARVLGLEGGELATLFQIAMMGKLPYTALRDAVFSHPTLAESLNNLFMAMDTGG